jgi:hypothetical protein
VSWIVPADVTAVYPDVEPTQEMVDHVQGLAESVIGSQDSPSAGLKSVVVEIVRRFVAALSDDPNVTQESLGSWAQSRGHGLGLTDREIGALRRAAGDSGLWVQPTHRNIQLETELVPFTMDQERETVWKAHL